MYKVLLVDDEVLVRVGMKALIDWETEGFTIVGEASNGEAALEQIRLLKPDIVLTDVKMPVMDGLELIQKAKMCGFSCEFIILSSYDDFKYVKQAFTDDAKDYLLKLELEPESLLTALKRAATQCPGKQADQATETPRQILCRILKGGECSGWEQLYDSDYQIAAVCLDGTAELADMKDSMVNMMEEVSTNYGKGIWTWEAGGFCLGILELRDKDCWREFWQASNQMMRYAFNKGCFLGASEVMKNADDMQTAREQAVKSVETACFNACGVVQYNPEYVREHSGTSLLYEEQFMRMEQAVKNLEIESFNRELEGFIEIFRREILSPPMAMKICNIIHFIVCKGIQQWGLSGLVEDWKDMMAPMKKKADYIEWLERLKSSVCFDEAIGNDQFLLQVRLWVLSHLEDGVTLDLVAKKMGYSSSHFSRIFKQKMGMGFNLFVTKIKIEMAKRYLEQEEWKIYDIAAKTGYENAAYFSRIFHQEVGMTPLEYRMSIKKVES